MSATDKTTNEKSVADPRQTDTEFEVLKEFIKERDLTQITEAVKQNLRHQKATNLSLYTSCINYYNEYKLWGSYFPDQGDYTMAANRADALFTHLDDYEWLYYSLADYRSKRILVNLLYYWFSSDCAKIDQIRDKTFDQYFDHDLISCDHNEVFVDIGGFIGDSIINYVRNYGKKCYKKIYTYEIIPANIEYIKENIRRLELENIEICEKGAASENGTMFISANELSSIIHLADEGSYAVPIVKIDDDIKERVTFIKMDIEGAEADALAGCAETIRKHHPKLALSIYHNHKDPWKLAKMIYEYDQTYRFYIRYYGSAILPTEYLLYAI